jgi:hypothetical protein
VGNGKIKILGGFVQCCLILGLVLRTKSYRPMQENTGHKTQTEPRLYLKTQTRPRKTQGYVELALDQTQGSYDPLYMVWVLTLNKENLSFLAPLKVSLLDGWTMHMG